MIVIHYIKRELCNLIVDGEYVTNHHYHFIILSLVTNTYPDITHVVIIVIGVEGLHEESETWDYKKIGEKVIFE